jgi:hypothetical protein
MGYGRRKLKQYPPTKIVIGTSRKKEDRQTYQRFSENYF